jgi:hypothetical protein
LARRFGNSCAYIEGISCPRSIIFTHTIFEVEIERNVITEHLGWPEPGAASTDSGLGLNRCYADLRRLPWSEAKRVYAREEELVARIAASDDPEEEYEIIEDELYEDPEGIYALDIGLASTVVALSAARCVPFSSCNAGAFGGSHHELYPVVAFYGRPEMLVLLLECAEVSGVGLCNENGGGLVVYAADIRHMRAFAHALIQRRAASRALRFSRQRNIEDGLFVPTKQLELF